MKIQEPKQSGVTRRYVTVLVDPGELDCGQKVYPNSTWVGTIGLDAPHKVDQWTPVGYKPRGYKAAAVRLLAEVRQSIINGTAVIERQGLLAEVRQSIIKERES